jgi:hypothetical protein
MAQNENQQQDSWTEGVSNFRQAVEHNLTASRLLATGAIAVGAAATAYFWNPSRRENFFESSRKLSEDMTNWWSGLYSGSGRSGSDSSQGQP